MTLTYDKLEAICDEVKRLGYINEVPENTLDQVIMKKAGVSTYVVANTKRALAKANLIKPAAIGFWKFINPTAELEEAEQEAARLEEQLQEANQGRDIAESITDLD